MAVTDNKITSWKSDFRSTDTNTPPDDQAIGTDLGAEIRNIKSVVRKDIDQSFLNPVNLDIVEYATGRRLKFFSRNQLTSRTLTSGSIPDPSRGYGAATRYNQDVAFLVSGKDSAIYFPSFTGITLVDSGPEGSPSWTRYYRATVIRAHPLGPDDSEVADSAQFTDHTVVYAALPFVRLPDQWDGSNDTVSIDTYTYNGSPYPRVNLTVPASVGTGVFQHRETTFLVDSVENSVHQRAVIPTQTWQSGSSFLSSTVIRFLALQYVDQGLSDTGTNIGPIGDFPDGTSGSSGDVNYYILSPHFQPPDNTTRKVHVDTLRGSPWSNGEAARSISSTYTISGNGTKGPYFVPLRSTYQPCLSNLASTDYSRIFQPRIAVEILETSFPLTSNGQLVTEVPLDTEGTLSGPNALYTVVRGSFNFRLNFQYEIPEGETVKISYYLYFPQVNFKNLSTASGS